MRRALSFLVVGLAFPGMQTRTLADASHDIQLTTVPETVYKVRDPGRASTESWYFNLVVNDARNREGIRPLQAELQVFAGTVLQESTVLSQATLAQMQTTSYRVTPETDVLSLRRRFTLDEIFDFRLGFVAKPVAWEADRVRVTLTLEVPDAEPVTRTLDVPVRIYSQKTRLDFPMRGPAIVTQGQINNAGHHGHSNQFAIDVMGLNATYGPLVSDAEGNAQFAGWGREILAPADGKIVYVRNDVPDNPPDGDPRAMYSTVAEPILAIAGNCVVIDHGNREFSALMHLQRGSVTVEPGRSVQRGQVIGRLGNSGDSFGAHLHYQLQDGPDLFRASSLPVKFDDLPGVELARGVYFEPQ